MKKTVSNNNRRDILRKGASLFGITISAAAASAILSGCEEDTLKTSDTFEAFDISEAQELSSIGGAVKRTFGHQNSGRPVIIIRTGENDFVALSSVCPHLQCEVNLPTEDNESLYCPCHGSEFNTENGAAEKGPANSPLQSFSTVFEDDVLKILF